MKEILLSKIICYGLCRKRELEGVYSEEIRVLQNLAKLEWQVGGGGGGEPIRSERTGDK